MVFELFKVGFAFQTLPNWTRQAQTFALAFQNAMRATMELYGDAMEYPAVHAQVALGNEDLTVKVKPSRGVAVWRIVSRPVCVTSFPSQVSDRGGGVPLRKIERLFTYTYSTAPRPSLDGSRAAPLVSGPDAARRQKQPIPKVTSPSCFPRLATDTASRSLDCTRATFRATWSSTPWRVMEPTQWSTSGWLILS